MFVICGMNSTFLIGVESGNTGIFLKSHGGTRLEY